MQQMILSTVLRSLAAVVIGGLIGSERARHGRAAGMRTHILVCLGACMTSMTSILVSDIMGNNGDVFRIPAQVVSGIGFFGRGHDNTYKQQYNNRSYHRRGRVDNGHNRRGARLRLLCGRGSGYGAVFIHNSFVCKV